MDRQPTTDDKRASSNNGHVLVPRYSDGAGIRRRVSIGSQGHDQPTSPGIPNPLSSSRSHSASLESVGDTNRLADTSTTQNQTEIFTVGGGGGKFGTEKQTQESSAASPGIVIFVLLGICLFALSIYLCFVAFKKRLLEREKSKGRKHSDNQPNERPIAIIVEEAYEGDGDASFNDLENLSRSSSTDTPDSLQSFNGEEDLSTLDGDGPSFIDANPDKLGKHHSILNVHRCASATCICRKQGNNIHFFGTKPKGAVPVLPTDPNEAEAWFRARARAHLYVNQIEPSRHRPGTERFCKQISTPSTTVHHIRSHLVQQNLGFAGQQSYEEALRDAPSPKSADSLSLDASIMSDESEYLSDEYYSGESSKNMTAKDFLYSQGLASRMCMANNPKVKGPNEIYRLAGTTSRREGTSAVFITNENPSEDDESVSDYVLNREDDFTVETISDYVLGRPDEQMAKRMAIQRNRTEESEFSSRNLTHTVAHDKYGDDESRLLAVMYGSGEGIRGRDKRSPTSGRNIHERRRPSPFEKEEEVRMPPQHLIEYEE